MSSPSAASGAEGRGSYPPEHLLRGVDLVPSDLVNVEHGRSGFAWRVRFGAQSAVVRFSSSAREQAIRLAALRAAGAAGLPVPSVLRHVANESGALLVLDWLPGVPLASYLGANPAEAEACGRRFGQLQRRLHTVRAPDEVPPVSEPPEPAYDRAALLHLDWHPYNVLADADGTITGVIDWDNVRRGDPGLDLARTWAMLTADPALPAQPEQVRASLPSFVRGWAEGYGGGGYEGEGSRAEGSRSMGEGSAYDLVDDSHRRWAARLILSEWRTRPLPSPDALDPLRRIASG